MAELVLLALDGLHRALLRQRALGDDDDREVAAARVAAADQPAHLLDVERALGDQDHAGAAGQPGVQRDPAGVATHHLHDHHAVVRLGRGVEAVDGVGGDLHRGVEPERHVRPAEVVVDRLRHADHRQAVRAVQLRGRPSVSSPPIAIRPSRLSVERFSRMRSAPSSCLKGFVRELQDGAAARQDPARRLDRELLVGVLDRAAPAVAKADDRVPVAIDPLAHDRADHRVEAGTVATSREHAYPHAPQRTRARAGNRASSEQAA